MLGCRHLWKGSVLALGLSTPMAQADQMALLEQTCTPPQGSFAAQIEKARGLGWSADQTHPAARQFQANFASLSSNPKVETFQMAQGGETYVLAVSSGRGIIGCRILNARAQMPADADAFARRFDLLTRPQLGAMNRLDHRFFASADAVPVPAYAMLPGARPKTDRGLTGQLMSGSYFSK